MSVPEPTENAMLPPEPDADDPVPKSTAPLLPTVAFPELDGRLPDMPAVPLLLVDTAMLPKPVVVPMPNEIVMKLPEAVLPSPSLILTPSPLVVPSPKAKYGAPASTTIPSLASATTAAAEQTTVP
jgi:hypothetical protein